MTDTMHASKQELMATAETKMLTEVTTGNWTLRQKIALTCRALSDAGHDSGLAGQISARGGQPGTFVTQRLGLGFDEITEDNLLLVNEDLEVLDGEGMPNPANRFHSWIYRARTRRQLHRPHTPTTCDGAVDARDSPRRLPNGHRAALRRLRISRRLARGSRGKRGGRESFRLHSATSGQFCSPTTANSSSATRSKRHALSGI